jgi:hypothetical protein
MEGNGFFFGEWGGVGEGLFLPPSIFKFLKKINAILTNFSFKMKIFTKISKPKNF